VIRWVGDRRAAYRGSPTRRSGTPRLSRRPHAASRLCAAHGRRFR